jgi:acyl-CoA synthetase (AMP-forming)/AMP-acid ligase II
MRTDLHDDLVRLPGVRLPARVAGPDSPLGTLVDLCRARAAAEPDRRGYVFLADGVDESDSLTLAELDCRARAVAVTLRELAPAGARVLLSYHPGLDFHAAFWGCLYTGLVAVPVAPLDGTRHNVTWTRVDSVAASAQPALFLSTQQLIAGAEAVLADTPGLAGLARVATDELDTGAADRWSPPEITADTVAYLQYSSGSTGLPKGVTLTHGNVLHNLALIYDNSHRPADDAGLPRPPVVAWLPVHYNMGLVGGLLDPLFSGRDATLMPAAVFVQRPYSWLRAISDLGRADSCAPNFAYDLCVRRVTDEQRRRLDLSRWEVALLGGEPVRAATLDRFSQAFARCGFRREALFPGYGLAESTVMVTGGPAGHRPMILQLDPVELAAGRARPAEPGDGGRELVGCGRVHPSVTVVAADPATGERCGENEVGEILVSGPSIGTGYWNAPEVTAETFSAQVPGYPGRRFLRTGDLGFRHGGQLFITGRAKDVIIIAGANHYPQDIEATAEASHPAVRELCCCALSVDEDDRERLVVLAEVSPEALPAGSAAAAREIEDAVRRMVRAEHGLQVHDVVLLPPGSLPFTTNVKLQRRECRARYLDGTFDAARHSTSRASGASGG